MTQLIIPPDYVETVKSPITYLKGPSGRSGDIDDWESKAAEYIFSEDPSVAVANPRGGQVSFARQILGSSFIGESHEEKEWEKAYMAMASEWGALLFWFPGRDSRGDSYGTDLFHRLAEWKEEFFKAGPFHRVAAVGIEAGFPGRDYIACRISRDTPGLSIYSTLEETCDRAVEIAQIPPDFVEGGVMSFGLGRMRY